jgi:hypothetical protein
MEYNDAQDVQSWERRRINQHATFQKIAIAADIQGHKVFHSPIALL